MGIVVEMPKQMIPHYVPGQVFHAKTWSSIVERIEAKEYPAQGMMQAEIVADVAKTLNAELGRLDGYTIEIIRNLKFHRV